jgi:hypothetical protein
MEDVPWDNDGHRWSMAVPRDLEHDQRKREHQQRPSRRLLIDGMQELTEALALLRFGGSLLSPVTPIRPLVRQIASRAAT